MSDEFDMMAKASDREGRNVSDSVAGHGECMLMGAMAPGGMNRGVVHAW
jgi:hypothetical protein